ncbi:MAG: OmpH family outer membrane protein [Desulfosarcina sp.]|nr:OmpH family outer membrane protein [Desulfobacterales bacterium]
MQNRIIIFASFLFFFLLLASSEAANVAKIGVVNFQKIMQNSSAGKAALSQINTKRSEMEKNLKAKGAEIEGMKKKFDRESLVMSKEMRGEKEREFRIKINDIKAIEKKYEAELKEMNNKLLMKFQKDVMEIAKNIGKKEGYLLIVEKNTAGVLYSPDSIEMTDKIIKIYNDQTSKEKIKKK